MAFGLLQMFLERLGKLLVRRRLGHLWERPCELDFGAVKILQFVDERVMECFDFHNKLYRCSRVQRPDLESSMIALNEG